MKFKKRVILPLDFFKILFIYLFEREHKQDEGRREKPTPHQAGSSMLDSIPELWDHDLSQRQTLSQLSHPGTPCPWILMFW